MPISAAVRERVRTFLDEDAEIRYVFPADILMSAQSSVLVVVSGQAITGVVDGILVQEAPKWVLARLPRNIVLGPVDTQSTPYFSVAGIDYEIDEEYIAVVAAADAEITSSADSPPDPLPDL